METAGRVEKKVLLRRLTRNGPPGLLRRRKRIRRAAGPEIPAPVVRQLRQLLLEGEKTILRLLGKRRKKRNKYCGLSRCMLYLGVFYVIVIVAPNKGQSALAETQHATNARPDLDHSLATRSHCTLSILACSFHHPRAHPRYMSFSGTPLGQGRRLDHQSFLNKHNTSALQQTHFITRPSTATSTTDRSIPTSYAYG